MAYGYWKCGIAERDAVFHLTFRKHPFGGQYAICCGLSYVVEFLDQFRFSPDDLVYLASLKGADDKSLFEKSFLDYLGEIDFRCDVDAIAEGTAVFANEPLVRVIGPILQAQLIETALLNTINFQTLIATKASRICRAAGQDSILEFGLRRAQGIDGGLAASRAAFIGGCAATSNVLAGKLFGIPVKGTHAHSWVMAFEDELKSFQSYADAMPNNCVFLVDTYNTTEGIRHAITVARRLRRDGHEVLGVRLDSGDLGQLSQQARNMLDQAGFPDAAIVASNDLDEYEISNLKRKGAKINVWGVGTRLATAYDQPALGGVYKLAALRNETGEWTPRIKLSEQEIKISNPGIQQVRRFQQTDGQLAGDIIYDELQGIDDPPTAIDLGGSQSQTWGRPAEHADLLVPVFRQGRRAYEPPTATETRSVAASEIAKLPDEITRLNAPNPYRVSLEKNLYRLRSELISAAIDQTQ